MMTLERSGHKSFWVIDRKNFLWQKEIQKNDGFFPVYCTSTIYLHVRVMKIVPMTQISILIMFRPLQLSKYVVLFPISVDREMSH